MNLNMKSNILSLNSYRKTAPQLQQRTLLPWAPLYSMAIQIRAQPPAVYS